MSWMAISENICVHTNFLSPSYFVSPPYYVSSTNCLFISVFNVKQGSTCGVSFGYTLSLLLSPDQAKILIFSFSAVKIFIFEKSDIQINGRPQTATLAEYQSSIVIKIHYQFDLFYFRMIRNLSLSLSCFVFLSFFFQLLPVSV